MFGYEGNKFLKPFELSIYGNSKLDRSFHGNSTSILNHGHGIFLKFGSLFFLTGIHSNSNQSSTFTDLHYFKNWIQTFDPPDNDFDDLQCGIMSKSAGLVQGNQFSLRDQFPWVVSIVFNGGFNNNGALVSDRHIITYIETVASWNTILQKYIPDSLHSFKIYLGSTKINDASKAGSIVANPSEIHLHPHVRRIGDTPINSIAIVSMKYSVQFNKFIRPICIWTFDNSIELIKYSHIYGVGYGKDDTGSFSGVRKHAKVSLKDEGLCREVYSDALDVFNETKLLCVQGNGRETPCFRDTPLFVKFNDKWYLRGILLRLRYWVSNGTCIFDKPLLYEDVAQNYQWILSQIKY